MSKTETRAISAVEAARRIYNTPHPTGDQVGRTVKKIEAGTLLRSDRGGATTTLEALAEYMARREEARSGRSGIGKQSEALRHTAAGVPVTQVYHSILKDYFLAVLLRRKMSHRSGAFQRVVLGSQVVLLLGIVLFLGFISAQALKVPFVPPRHQAAKVWIAKEFPKSEIREIRPVHNSPELLHVKFRYMTNKRIVDSKLVFKFDGNTIKGIDSGE